MSRCSCGSEVAEGKRFCGDCGAAVGRPTTTPTQTSLSSQPGVAGAAYGPTGGSRFLPGTILAGRYRMVGLVGRGGMGEVYRADDLKLAQPVALKFLPPALEADPARLQRLLNEVRTARQVSHPHVCRVYDVGEAGGRHFLSMEYVDGEDLASLLRRIGRPPEDKAIQLARQLCAGLAAAHRQGILHRDLKPANVMIDGRGQARITDFGLAGLAESFDGAEITAGTPAYMSPEQLAGREVSVRSDIYCLGLVLYELFTGQAAFAADAIDLDQRSRKRPSSPSQPSGLVPGLDPAVERVVLRCLEQEPGLRPASALAVSAALPGGEPLAEALAAGETPSPEMVAAAGGVGALDPWVGSSCLAGVLVGLLAIALTHRGAFLAAQVDLPKPPEALAFEARGLLEQLDYTEPPADRAHGFEYDADRLQHVGESDETGWDELHRLRPAPIAFWYRQSPRYLVPLDFNNIAVTPVDPQPVVSGMAAVRLDPQGRLLRLHVVPDQVADDEQPAAAPDWSVLFRRAGLDIEGLAPARSRWVPPVYCDRREAWVGSYRDQPEVPVRVEAGAYRGRPVYFELVLPWSRARRMAPEAGPTAIDVVAMAMLFLLLLGAALLARINLRLRRGDRRGAFRLAAVFFVLNTSIALFGSHHVPDFSELRLFFQTLAWGLMTSAMVWLTYLALEPYARRLWPDILISWSRLLAGRPGDPLVGRDVLIGGAAGVVLVLVTRLGYFLPRWLGWPWPPPGFGPAGGFQNGGLFGLESMRQAVSMYFHLPQVVLSNTIAVVFLLLLLRVILRRPWPAVAATWLIFAAIGSMLATNPSIDLPIAAIAPALFLFVLIRFGMLSLAALFLVALIDQFCVLTLDLSAWYLGRSLLLLALVSAVFVWAFHASLGGRPLLVGLGTRDLR